MVRDIKFGQDGNFQARRFSEIINSDLANNYGNLCQRVISFNEKNFNLKIPECGSLNEEDILILDNFNNEYNKIVDSIENQDINFYANFIQNQLFKSNKYFNDQEPWKKKNDINRVGTIIYVSLELIRKVSIMLYPIIPESSLKVLKIFNINEKDIKFESIKKHNILKKNQILPKLSILFKKIEKND